MKRYYPYFIGLCLTFFTACSMSVKKKNYSIVYPMGEMKVLLDSFVSEVDVKNKINEIYIDKISVWEYDVIIYSGKESLTESAKALTCTVVDKDTFYIYSGIEHFFSNIKDDKLLDDGPNIKGPPLGDYWVINEKNDSLTILKGEWASPFYSSPIRFYNDIKFLLPYSDSLP